VRVGWSRGPQRQEGAATRTLAKIAATAAALSCLSITDLVCAQSPAGKPGAGYNPPTGQPGAGYNPTPQPAPAPAAPLPKVIPVSDRNADQVLMPGDVLIKLLNTKPRRRPGVLR